MRFPDTKYLLHDLRRKTFAMTHREQARKFSRMRRRMKYDGYSLIPYDRNRCIFVRIPKCATQSVARSLFGNLGGGHLTIEDYRRVYSAAEFYTYYKFGVVRNPWDRLVSAYFFLQKGGVNQYDRDWYAANIADYRNFDDFVRQWLTPDNAASGLHFRPQHQFLCFANGTLGVDFVAHYEKLECDYAVVARRLGAEPSLQYVNASRNRRQDYRRYFKPDMVDIVSKVYARDIELFGYDFDGSSKLDVSAVARPSG